MFIGQQNQLGTGSIAMNVREIHVNVLVGTLRVLPVFFLINGSNIILESRKQHMYECMKGLCANILDNFALLPHFDIFEMALA